MRRQFLRIYLGIAVVLFLAAAATLYFANRTLGEIHRRNFRLRAIGTVTPMGDALSEATDPEVKERILKALQGDRRLRIRETHIDDLSLSVDQKQRLLAGEALPIDTPDGLTVAAPLPDGRALAVTFVPPPPPDEPGIVFLGVLAATLVLVGVAFYLLVRPLERRIGLLASTAERFGKGELQARAHIGSDDAIGELARTFNGMADRIGALIEGQKDLLRAVSHELRTPLARVFFMLDDAEDAVDPRKKDAILLRIQASLTDLNDLVEELLTFVRLEEGAVSPAPERVDVPAVCDEMRAVVSDLRGDLSLEVDAPEVELTAIPRYFRRAVLNLVTNAARHARHAVRISCGSAGSEVRITVEDDGPGVPKTDRARIFEPFQRVDESRSSAIGGAGLGLAIVRRISLLHGGSVSVDASRMGGARFTLTLPSTFRPSSADTPSPAAP